MGLPPPRRPPLTVTVPSHLLADPSPQQSEEKDVLGDTSISRIIPDTFPRCFRRLVSSSKHTGEHLLCGDDNFLHRVRDLLANMPLKVNPDEAAVGMPRICGLAGPRNRVGPQCAGPYQNGVRSATSVGHVTGRH